MKGRGRGQRLIAIGCALLLGVGLALPPQAEAGTFTLVPTEHWAYDALDQLTSDKGPGEPLTRYELAIRIRDLAAKVDGSEEAFAQVLVDRLTAEFAPEIERLDTPTQLAATLDDELLRRARRAIGTGPTDLPSPLNAGRSASGSTPLPPLAAPQVTDETLRSSLEKLSQLGADIRLGEDARLSGGLLIDPNSEGGASSLRGASAGLELSLSPTTTLTTAYAIGRDDASDAEHSAKFDLKYELTPETSLRAAYRLVNFDRKQRSSEAQAEISIRF